MTIKELVKLADPMLEGIVEIRIMSNESIDRYDAINSDSAVLPSFWEREVAEMVIPERDVISIVLKDEWKKEAVSC